MKFVQKIIASRYISSWQLNVFHNFVFCDTEPHKRYKKLCCSNHITSRPINTTEQAPIIFKLGLGMNESGNITPFETIRENENKRINNILIKLRKNRYSISHCERLHSPVCVTLFYICDFTNLLVSCTYENSYVSLLKLKHKDACIRTLFHSFNHSFILTFIHSLIS